MRIHQLSPSFLVTFRHLNGSTRDERPFPLHPLEHLKLTIVIPHRKEVLARATSSIDYLGMRDGQDVRQGTRRRVDVQWFSIKPS